MRVYENANTALKDERDALAAYVEDVRAACISGGQWAERVIAIGRVLNQSPTTSLARLKAEWQAEALEKAAYRIGWEHLVEPLRAQAAELRLQAEEGSHE